MKYNRFHIAVDISTTAPNARAFVSVLICCECQTFNASSTDSLSTLYDVALKQKANMLENYYNNSQRRPTDSEI